MVPRKFPLAAVLAFRQQKELAEERALAACAARVAEARRALEQVQTQIVDICAAGSTQAGPISAAFLHEKDLRWRSLRETRSQIERELARRESERLTQQQQFLAARRDREMLTDLRDKQRATLQAERAAAEQRLMNDLFTARHTRS